MKIFRHLPAGAAVLLALLLPVAAFAQFALQPDLNPIQDPGLQAELNWIVDTNGWGDMVDNNRLAVALVVLNDQGGYRMAMLNGHLMLYAASLPKLAVLFAAMVAAQEGDLQIDEALEQDLNNMIRVSCNACATRVMGRVGRDKLLQILQRPEYAFYDENLYGGLWVGKDYGPSARAPTRTHQGLVPRRHGFSGGQAVLPVGDGHLAGPGTYPDDARHTVPARYQS